MGRSFFLEDKRMHVKYIGDHVKTDSITGVGLRWEPGQVRNVSNTLAAVLLQYTDTWREVSGGRQESEEDEPIGLRDEEKKEDEPLEVVDFHAMNKDQLLKFAKDNWNEGYNKHWGEHVIRERVIKRHTKEQMDRAEEGR